MSKEEREERKRRQRGGIYRGKAITSLSDANQREQIGSTATIAAARLV